ncbi:peptidase inhibitor family I36 protein [Gallaecimonas kandeliae]|uniref:RICIN domain-containing protein n=1 Tax=Gallaecimonas kandeliae TaxID=3029055 RepID=UPI00264909A0|nr:peptidase inhibitor family I36 protein [Gallaecimonas kandeliae]WKE64849.1 peptidase inhibitor family I36 protein [Gallaecimonas kandeliae]
MRVIGSPAWAKVATNAAPGKGSRLKAAITLVLLCAAPAASAYDAACFTEGNANTDGITSCKDAGQSYSAGSGAGVWWVQNIRVKEGYRVDFSRQEWDGPYSQSWRQGSYDLDSWWEYYHGRGPFQVVHDDDFDESTQVCLYKQPGGNGLRYCSDQDLSGLANFNDLARSVTLPPGYVAELYEHTGFQGAKLTLSDNQDLGDLAGKVSSMKVFKGLAAFDPGQDYYLVPALDKYRLSRFALEQGQRLSVADLEEEADGQHWHISSLKDGVAALVDGNGAGLCFVKPEDQATLGGDPNSDACRWQVEIVEDNLFRFKNRHYGQYLTMADDKSVSLSQETGPGSQWRLKAKDEVQSYARYLAGNAQERISTDPDAPRVPPAQRNASYGSDNDYQQNGFDWRRLNWPYVGYVGSSNPTEQPPLISPFYQDSLSRYPFAAPAGSSSELPDMQPQSGWELVKHNLGYHMLKGGQTDVPFDQKTYGMPYVMLYNRYTGRLRAIVLYDQAPGIYNAAAIELSHSGGNGRVASNLFSPYAPMSLDRQAGTTRVTAMAPLIANEDKQWIYADFELGYDPCTACYASVLTLKVSPMANGETRLTGRYTGNSVPVRDASSFLDADYLTSYFNDAGLDDRVGATTFKSYRQFYEQFKDQKDYATAVYDEKLWTNTSDSATALQKTGEALGLLATASPEPISSAVLGSLSSLFGFANFSVPAKIEGFDLPPPMPTVTVGEMALRGETTFMGNTDDVSIATPGSLNAKDAPETGAYDNSGAYPTYNEPLGVFAMVKLPNVGVAQWVSSIDGDGYNCTSSFYDGRPTGCNPTTLDGNFYYTLNPNSDWHPEDVDVFVAIERLENGRRKAQSAFVPIEKWQQLQVPGSTGNDVRFNLKVVVAQAGLVAGGVERLLADNGDRPRLLMTYSYPLKLWQQHDNGYLKRYPMGTPSGVSRPYPDKPFYLDPQELQGSFCTDGGYQVSQTPLSGQ